MPSQADIISCPSLVVADPGASFTVTVEVHNVGDESDTFTIELIDHNGNVVDSVVGVAIDPCASATVDLTGTAPTTEGRYTWKVRATPDRYPEYYDEESFTLVADYTELYYDTAVSISETVDIYRQTSRYYDTAFSVTETVSIYRQTSRYYETAFSVTETISVYRQTSRYYDTAFSISEVVNIYRQTSRYYENAIAISETVDVLRQTSRYYETAISITEIVRGAIAERYFETEIQIAEVLKYTRERTFRVDLYVRDTVFVVAKGVISPYISMLSRIIEEMEYVHSGDIVMPNEWNLVIKALETQAQINEAVLDE